MRGNADNRITEVETSADAQNWHHDARYFYYPHGPLQRVELGEHLVQGTDYAYTLQVWLKGINGDRLNPTTDMGRDGDATVVDNPNLLTGRDAYALSLGYYGDNDYKAIASSYDSDSPANIAQRPFAPIGGVGTMNTEHTPLYNGNIAHTMNTLQHFGLWDATNGDQGQVLAMVYRYDQLNRLRTARGLVGLGNTNTWNGVNDAATNRYRSEYTYDANGNIETVERYDADGTGHYDSFAYHYHTNGGRKQQNRLYELIDDATMNTGFDIVTTATGFDNTSNGVNVNNNYGYDALGNLVRDDREDIELIHWTVAGKVDSIQRPSASSRSPLKFRYGASGQRVSKQVGDFYCTDPGAYREHYIRDAQGNIMATYRYTNTGTASLKLNERPLYGSSRLGSMRKEVELHTLPSFDPASANPVQMVDLNYELTDHLGNVCAVVTGRLLDGNGGGTAKQAELVSAQGYEPFGSLLPGRNYSSDSCRFGFNGQLKDDEIYNSTGTSYTAEFWQYDPRTARRWNLDPKPNPSLSYYSCFANSPIQFCDLAGDTIRLTNAFKDSKEYMRSYDEWMKTDAGKQFSTDYGVGGKYEHVAIVFDAGPLQNSWASGETRTELVSVADPTNITNLGRFLGAEKDAIPGIRAVVNGQDNTQFLRFTITLPTPSTAFPPTDFDIAGNVETLLHEKQHVEIELKAMRGLGTLPTSRQQHDIMRDRSLRYYKERSAMYWSIKHLWSDEYYEVRNTEYINRNPFKFVEHQINGFIDY